LTEDTFGVRKPSHRVQGRFERYGVNAQSRRRARQDVRNESRDAMEAFAINLVVAELLERVVVLRLNALEKVFNRPGLLQVRVCIVIRNAANVLRSRRERFLI
jgi:hypothetical protein